MSKVAQIQGALLQLDGGTFQKLADAYLYRKGYKDINPIGSVIGADKTRKGTPDTFVKQPNGKYIFFEHTTQQDDVLRKIEYDLDKCFDKDKTGISSSDIQEIVVCYNSNDLSASEVDSLSKKCQEKGVNFNSFGNGRISYDLYQEYPDLAYDFLRIEIDTGQIVTSNQFITKYNESKLATRLDTTFHFHESEIEQILKGLENEDLIIISGRPGIGKTRFALECCNQFKKLHPEYDVWIMRDRGLDVFNDLRSYFSEKGNFLILVDDANRINRFEHIISLLQDQRADQRIKVIATVRDYALHKIHRLSESNNSRIELELSPLEEKQIKQLIMDEYKIFDPLFLERMTNIAQGNPRLAIMAAEIVKKDGTFQSLIDITNLYEKYFESIRHDLEDSVDKNIIKVAAIIAFFGSVDRSNSELMGSVKDAFGINQDVFWDAARSLHDLEIVDMYENNEVVKISDQVLATYLFYLAFFKDRLLNFSSLLDHFFPSLRNKIIDAINPVLNAFDNNCIEKVMLPAVNNVCDSLKKAGDKEALFRLMETFWFLKPTEILLCIRDTIKDLKEEPIDTSKIKFVGNSWVPSPSILNLLRLFSHQKMEYVIISLDLLLDYVDKRPDDIPFIIHILAEDFGFKYTSYISNYAIEKTVIDKLWTRTNNGKNYLCSKLFLSIAEIYLHTQFRSLKGGRGHTFNIRTFSLAPHPEVFELRKIIWEHLFELFDTQLLQPSALKILRNYHTLVYPDPVLKIMEQDAKKILPFFASKPGTVNYAQCRAIQEYLNFLEKHNIEFDPRLRQKYVCEAYNLSKVLLVDWREKRCLKLEDYEELKRSQIIDYFDKFDIVDYKHIFELCEEIQEDKKNGSLLSAGILQGLDALANQKPYLYVKVLKLFLQTDNPFDLNPFFLIERLMWIFGSSRTYEIINEYANPLKRILLFSYYRSLPQGGITTDHLDQICKLYQEAEIQELPLDFDFLLRYHSIDEDIIAGILEIILGRLKNKSTSAFNFFMLFNPYADIDKVLFSLIDRNPKTFKQAYFIAYATNEVDLYGKIFNHFLDLDPEFISEYINYVYEKEIMDSDTPDYASIWMRGNYEAVMLKAIEDVYKHEQKCSLITDFFIDNFFILSENGKNHPEIRMKQDRLLIDLIRCQHQDSTFMRFIFGIIAHFPPESRNKFFAIFIEFNKRFGAFRELPLEPNSCGWVGSAVPMLQNKLDYYNTLMPLLNTVDLLEHKQYIEMIIQGIQLQIESEKKKDFMEDD